VARRALSPQSFGFREGCTIKRVGEGEPELPSRIGKDDGDEDPRADERVEVILKR
jgi:hypothetical protein